MPRARPAHRLDDLVRHGAQAFIRYGYRQCQIDGVAKAMGVAKGTVYLYVDSKAALFDLVIRGTDPDGFEPPESLPYSAPDFAETVAHIQERIGREAQLNALGAALAIEQPNDIALEVESIIAELYKITNRNRIGLKVIDRCAPEFPELGTVFFGIARNLIPGMLRSYIDKRAAAGFFRTFSDTEIVARTWIEAITFWAMHHHWDPAPSEVTDEIAMTTLVELAKGALILDRA